jgi:hypothetical protein
LEENEMFCHKLSLFWQFKTENNDKIRLFCAWSNIKGNQFEVWTAD